MSENGKIFHQCSKCGKNLIEEKDGKLIFCFGKSRDSTLFNFIPVEMCISGVLKMRCIRKSCRKDNPDHWEVIHLLRDNG